MRNADTSLHELQGGLPAAVEHAHWLAALLGASRCRPRQCTATLLSVNVGSCKPQLQCRPPAGPTSEPFGSLCMGLHSQPRHSSSCDPFNPFGQHAFMLSKRPVNNSMQALALDALEGIRTCCTVQNKDSAKLWWCMVNHRFLWMACHWNFGIMAGRGPQHHVLEGLPKH